MLASLLLVKCAVGHALTETHVSAARPPRGRARDVAPALSGCRLARPGRDEATVRAVSWVLASSHQAPYWIVDPSLAAGATVARGPAPSTLAQVEVTTEPSPPVALITEH